MSMGYGTSEEQGHLRRVPRQARSRQRVEAILSAAQELIVESGSDAMTMSDVAVLAGVPIGSVYQYFPDKASILRELALRFMERTRGMLAEGLQEVRDKDEAMERIDAVLAGYYDLFLSEPDIRDMWAATQSDKELQQLDVEDSTINGGIIADAVRHLVPVQSQQRLEAVTVLFAHLSGAGARLALAVGRDKGDAMMVELRASVRRALDEILV